MPRAEKWPAREDSNSRPAGSKPAALLQLSYGQVCGTSGNRKVPGFWQANSAQLPLTLAEKPGFEPGQDLRPARLANECLRPLGHFSGKWGEPPDSNRHRPGSRPGALPIKLGTPLFGGGWRDRTPTPFRASRFSRPISTPALRASEYGADSRQRSGNLLGGSQALCHLSYVRVERGLEGRIRTCGLLRPRQALCQAELLPECGGPGPIRTVDRAIIDRVLCLLSYRSVEIRTGFEPAITRLKASWLNHSPTGS